MQKTCQECGREYSVKPSQMERSKFCSVECRKAGVGKMLKGRGGRKRSGHYLSCRYCGKPFYVNDSEVKRKNRMYCSNVCRLADPQSPIKRTGEHSSNWRGGRTNIGGYVYLRAHEHPNCNSGGYVAEHRLVMEKALGRHLRSYETVHHRNAIKDDNRIENLELMTRSPHAGVVTCPHCEEEFTIR